jgi:hypothetical protein
MVDHSIDVLASPSGQPDTDGNSLVSAHPKIREMIAELPGLRVETADHVYK